MSEARSISQEELDRAFLDGAAAAGEHWRSVAETARAVIVAEYSELRTAAMAVANSPYDSAERRDAIIRLRAAVHAGDAHERT